MAFTVLELSDSDFLTYLFSQRFSIAAAAELPNNPRESNVVFYENDVWKYREHNLIDETQLKNTRFGVSGTAATVANLSSDSRVDANLESCIKNLLKQR